MACLGATSSTCSGLTTDESCVAPKTFNAAFPDLESVSLSYDGTDFLVEWAIGTSYPTHKVRGFIRKASVSSFSLDGIPYVSRDVGSIDLDNGGITDGVDYRITIRVESETEFGDTLTLEIPAEIISEYPVGESLVIYGTEEILFGTDYVIE